MGWSWSTVLFCIGITIVQYFEKCITILPSVTASSFTLIIDVGHWWMQEMWLYVRINAAKRRTAGQPV